MLSIHEPPQVFYWHVGRFSRRLLPIHRHPQARWRGDGEEDEDEFKSDRGSNQQTKPKVDKPTEEASQNKRLLSPDAQSDDNALETHEQMIDRAYCHVEMAREHDSYFLIYFESTQWC